MLLSILELEIEEPARRLHWYMNPEVYR